MVFSVDDILPKSTSDWIGDGTSIVTGTIFAGAVSAEKALKGVVPQTIIRMNQINSSMETLAKFSKGSSIISGVITLGVTSTTILDRYLETGTFGLR